MQDSLSLSGLFEAVEHATIRRGVPFLGICVGMQLLATVGLEHGHTPGFDWIPGQVEPVQPNDRKLKIPHMGWNELGPNLHHPLFHGLPPVTDVYFVHSYHFVPKDPAAAIAWTDYAGPHSCRCGARQYLWRPVSSGKEPNRRTGYRREFPELETLTE